ncbi:Phophatidylserine decarboxylase-domain-containing protein [Hypoxylon sp. NC1633]|nr:Phophatidylserine decarboxylase-domain-containing protein [Hypoxylon sp. NC1633]
MTAIISIPHRQRHVQRAGSWLPHDPKILVDWVRDFVADVDRRSQSGGLPGLSALPDWPEAVQELNNLVQGSAELRMLASAMLEEVPDKVPYKWDPIGHKQIRDFEHLLDLFACIMTERAPEWSRREYDVGLIGFPFNAILDWPMATPSGYAFFLKAEVNQKLKVILNTWRDNVLMTDKSLYVITKDKHGWLSDDALATIAKDTNVDGEPEYTFQELFKCTPDDDPDHWGFTSWDHFFVREFSDINRLRPVGKTDPAWVINSCESKPIALQTDVKEYDTFWLKGQPYSVTEMLNKHEKAQDFVGGTVYQAFLSATSYHRWTSPVKGNVVYSSVIDGTYFSEPTISGFSSSEGPDTAGPDRSQGYITHVATRAMFLIQAEDPIGLMCVIFVGMADVSTCEISPEFQHDLPTSVERGAELGMFHHGGSTHCLLFRKGLKLAWVSAASPGTAKRNIPIRRELAYCYDWEKQDDKQA